MSDEAAITPAEKSKPSPGKKGKTAGLPAAAEKSAGYGQPL